MISAQESVKVVQLRHDISQDLFEREMDQHGSEWHSRLPQFLSVVPHASLLIFDGNFARSAIFRFSCIFPSAL